MTSANRPTRRDFLQVRAAVQAVAATLNGGDPIVASPPASGALVSLRRRAMASEFEVQLAADRQDGATARALAALDLVEALEDQLTVYRAESEVIRLNRTAAEGPVALEPRLFAVLQLAARIHRETGGAFDLTSGPLSEVWGFSRRAGRLPSDAEIVAAMARVGMADVVLDAHLQTVAFRRPGLSLHLNSIGKGYALDRMAELLDGVGGDTAGAAPAAPAVTDYLLHGGRSSVLARGNCPGGARPGWTIGVPHPLRLGKRLGEIDLVDQALGTSGSGTQFFEHDGRRYGHLLDPRTGRPAEGIYTATVVAPTAAEADALSTAFYVMGPAGAADYCAAHRGIGAILILVGDDESGRADNSASETRIESFGLEVSRWRPLAAG